MKFTPLRNQVASRNKKRFPLERTPSKGPGLEKNNTQHLTSCVSASLSAVFFKVFEAPVSGKTKAVSGCSCWQFWSIKLSKGKIAEQTEGFSDSQNFPIRFAPPPPIWSLAVHQALAPHVFSQRCVKVVLRDPAFRMSKLPSCQKGGEVATMHLQLTGIDL